MNRAFLLCLLAALASSIAGASGENDQEGRRGEQAGAPLATPLREMSEAQASDGYMAWIEPILCDGAANQYLIVAPHASVEEVAAARKAQRAQPMIPRKVLRLSADGKQRMTFDPADNPNLAKATQIKTLRMTIGPDDTLYVLVWATWGAEGVGGEKRGLYIVSFDNKGKYRAQVEVNYEKLLVREFEVFGSGDFLLIGHAGDDKDHKRIAILNASGGDFIDVPGWSSYPTGLAEEPGSQPGTELGDYMVRGGDGRIYFAEQDPHLEDIVIYAFEPSGSNGEVLRLRPRPRGQQFQGLKAAGGKVAALYYEAPPDGKSGRWWIAIFDAVLGGEMQSLYGPVPRKPTCYKHENSEDRFTMLRGGKVVMLAP